MIYGVRQCTHTLRFNLPVYVIWIDQNVGAVPYSNGSRTIKTDPVLLPFSHGYHLRFPRQEIWCPSYKNCCYKIVQ